MRTTIEINDEHRARLLELAARRGEKGFSRIVSDAIDAYMKSLATSEAARIDVLRLRGALKGKEVNDLLAQTEGIRKSWR